ncbi:MAG TPA: UDP-glucose/GDP-mannose dehydrogenase family protein, partial [Acidimicrobiales bacterium]|nr:UDP-glucose/GDP-mannose dehydrogenase family protein [Acidimicrobiales bacterium]
EEDPQRLRQLSAGVAPFHEPRLEPLLRSGMGAGRLRFTHNLAEAMDESDVVFVCVGTPPGPDGQPDMSAMARAARMIAENLHHYHVLVSKSTVPIGTGRWLKSVIEEHLGGYGNGQGLFSVVANPEFLREGTAVEDFLHPERVVLGSDDPGALDVLADVYRPILDQVIPASPSARGPVPLVRTDLSTGEMSKYASNAFLATKISFANEIARLCDFVGADVNQVTAVMGLDSRIGGRFLGAGLGWGGSCFGKDLNALVSTAVEYGYHPRILEASLAVNDAQRQLVVDELLKELRTLRGARICVLGLAFKGGTDDLRDSPGVAVATMLSARGAFVAAYDPMVNHFPEESGIRLCSDPYSAAGGADGIVVATDWPEFVDLDLGRARQAMHGDLFFDGRNLFDPKQVRAAGFRYLGIGRPRPGLERESMVGLLPAPTLGPDANHHVPAADNERASNERASNERASNGRAVASLTA